MTKAIFIDSVNRSIREVTIEGLKDMQMHVGGYIQSAYEWANGDTLYVDEEGMLKPQEHWFRISTRPDQPLAGNGLIVGSDDEGENADVATLLAEIDVAFYDRSQAASWAKANASDPAISISSIGPDGKVEETVIARYGSLFRNTMPKD